MTSLQPPSTKEDILHYLLKQGEATAQALAEHLDVSTQAIRRHLKDLSAEELIDHRIAREGMGRPNYLYTLSRKGRDRLPAQYDEFALSLLNTLAETVGQEQVIDILQKQWQRKAETYRQQVGQGPILERVQRLVQLRQAEGYMAEWHPVDADQDTTLSGYIITEFNCAISTIAESFPSVCGHELEMFRMALPDCSVERTHWLAEGEHQCGYLIQPESQCSN